MTLLPQVSPCVDGLIFFPFCVIIYSDGKMVTILDDELVYNILSAVEDIPEGRVASYGGIAIMIGRPKNH